MGKQNVAKVIEVVGSSKESWADAADRAVRVASKTVKNITGVQVVHMTAQVKAGKIATYKTTVKVAFGIEG
jgi:flavin-binding protein dodecin